VEADRIRIRQIMLNLVNNAIKFTDKGGITVDAKTDKDSMTISVKDTGIGIPADKHDTIFEAFGQVDTSTTRKTGGTGLGLPISMQLVELHGGKLWVESSGKAGKGSVFYIELPLESQIEEEAI
jgi:signal transduction histidine kinase